MIEVSSIVTIVCIIISVMIVLWALQIYMNYTSAQKRLEQSQIRCNTLELKIQEIENTRKEKAIEYSDNIMKYLRDFIAQIAVLRFKTFIDGHDMGKITKANVERLIQDIAEETKKSVNEMNILFDEMLITKDFYEKYIVETTIIIVKEMLEKYEET